MRAWRPSCQPGPSTFALVGPRRAEHLARLLERLPLLVEAGQARLPVVQAVRRWHDVRSRFGDWVPGDVVLAGGLALVSGWNVFTADDLLIKVLLTVIGMIMSVLTLAMVVGLGPGHRFVRVVRSWLARAHGSGWVDVIGFAIIGVLDVRRSPVTAAVLLAIAIPPLLVELRSRRGMPRDRH